MTTVSPSEAGEVGGAIRMGRPLSKSADFERAHARADAPCRWSPDDRDVIDASDAAKRGILEGAAAAPLVSDTGLGVGGGKSFEGAARFANERVLIPVHGWNGDSHDRVWRDNFGKYRAQSSGFDR